METVNGEWIMKGCNGPSALKSIEDCRALIHQIGFLPLFSNTIPGFSVEEHVPPHCWWSEDPETDPWVWRMILAEDPDIAYGKFFNKCAGFISKDFFPIFANYRRNGYDFEALFEDELASYRSKKVMDVFELNDDSIGKEIMSFDVKHLAGFGKREDGKEGEKGFEGVLTDLQMQTYLIMSRFSQKKNKKGEPYGWHIAALETPETKWGRGVVTDAYKEEPTVSWQRIVDRVLAYFPEAEETQIKKMLGIRHPGEAASPVVKKVRERKNIRPQELPWPENLMTEVGLENVFPGTGVYQALSSDQLSGLDHAMSTLKERERDTVILWYKERKTLKDIGEKYSISGSRVRQVIAKAVRKLRHRSRLGFYRDGYEATKKKQEEKDRVRITDLSDKIRETKGIPLEDVGFFSPHL